MFLDLILDRGPDFRIFRAIPVTGFEITGNLTPKMRFFFQSIANKKKHYKTLQEGTVIRYRHFRVTVPYRQTLSVS